MIHDFGASPKRTDRQATPDNFAKASEVGRNAEPCLGSAEIEAEAGHHFIEDEERLVFPRNFQEKLQITGLWNVEARVTGNRFQDDSGNFSRIRLERCFDCVGLVKWKNNRMLNE